MTSSIKTALGAAVLLLLGGAVGAFVATRFMGMAGGSDMAMAGPGMAASGVMPGASAAGPAERKVLYWYDPMFPTQKFNAPGKSPFMDMQLVPRYGEEDAGAGGSEGPTLSVSTAARQALGLRLAFVEQRSMAAQVQATGTLLLNDRDVAIVQARSAGFVERVQPLAPGDMVAAGAPMAELFNPEWLSAQQEFLAVKATGDAALSAAARQRLLLLGIAEAQVAQIERSGKPIANTTVTAPISGVVTELALRQGMTLQPGMTLARINGLSTVWLEAAVPEAQAANVAPGQMVQARFAALPGEVIQGRVLAILPEANRDTRTLRLRIALPNPKLRLRPGLLAQVQLQGPTHKALVVPAEAVIRSGRRNLVYLAMGDGKFSPVEVELGEQIDEWLTIRSGVAAGDQVVTSGQFLLDSEASLQGVMARKADLPAAAASMAMPASAAASMAMPGAMK